MKPTLQPSTPGPGAALAAPRLPPVPRVPPAVLRMLPDDRLVAMVRTGSEPAFEAIFDRHHRTVLAFCRHMVGSPEEAEDAVQHTFLAAYRQLRHAPGPIHLRPWLYTVARNRCLSMLRARRERPLEDGEEPATDNLAVGRPAARGPARPAARPLLAARRPARGARAVRARRRLPPGDRRDPGLPADQGEGAGLPGAHLARGHAPRPRHPVRGHPPGDRRAPRRRPPPHDRPPAPARVPGLPRVPRRGPGPAAGAGRAAAGRADARAAGGRARRGVRLGRGRRRGDGGRRSPHRGRRDRGREGRWWASRWRAAGPRRASRPSAT